MAEERKHAADLLKAVESYRDATQKALDACRRAGVAAGKNAAAKASTTPNVRFSYFPTGFS